MSDTWLAVSTSPASLCAVMVSVAVKGNWPVVGICMSAVNLGYAFRDVTRLWRGTVTEVHL